MTQSGMRPRRWGGERSGAGSGPSRLVAGQSWGPYRVGRLLGRGGMGEVYEAEHTRSGRRLAMKLLRSRLQNADERARFLREGQLAASVSHPHTVYIFGSEEISGTPVISMELTPGGTLKDRVASKGPLAPIEAVSAVLDIIGGLDAAQSAGILHRDIKPSNCFVDSQGSVKVGDFGLSISTLARDVQDDVSGRGFQGTPQFASPEQLRGEPLDVRSDIYAVGATLYYLLTGQPPFEAEDLRELVQKVTAQTPKSPRVLRSEIPSALASVVLRCLAKTPSERPASYADLARDLRPFSSTGQAPAALGVRFFAGLVDNVLLGAFVLVVGPASPVRGNHVMVPDPAICLFPARRFYRGNAGKAIVWAARQGARWRHCFLGQHRVAEPYFSSSNAGVYRSDLHRGDRALQRIPGGQPAPVLVDDGGLRCVWSVFPDRSPTQRVGGIHDLASRTRVVRRSGLERPRSVVATGITRPPGEQVAAGLHYGPFAVISDAGATDEGRLLVGFDPALRRRVWIQTHPLGTPTISAARRDASRTGRLHWLTGRRSAEENWDAFEAPDGESLERPPWPDVMAYREIVADDLANELHAAIQEETLPKLALDRIWVRSDGRLVLLDFPATGMSSDPSVGSAGENLRRPTSVRGGEFLFVRARQPELRAPAARSMIERWTAPAPPDLSEARAGLLDLLSAPDRVTRRRRGLVVGMTALPFLFAIVAALVSVLRPGPPEKAKCSSSWMRWKMAMCLLETTLTIRPIARPSKSISRGVMERRFATTPFGAARQTRNGLLASFASAPRRLRRVTRPCLPQTCRKPRA